MKILNTTIAVIILLFDYSFAQAPDTLWTKTYGGYSLDFGESVKQTTDGGFIICGWTGSFGSTSAIWLLKTDSSGDTIWTQIFDSGGSDGGFDVQQTIDGGYILTGRKDTFGATAGDVWFIKTNEYGDIIWTKTYGGIGFESGYSVKQTFDEGFILAGEQDFGCWLIKTDSIGDTVWTQNYVGTLQAGLDVVQTSDSGFIITGYLTDILGENLRLVKTNNTGDTLWTKTYIRGRGESVEQTADGGYIITGQNSTWDDLCLIKTDSNGNSEWEKRYGGNNEAHGYSVRQRIDNGYIITGYNSFSAGDHNLWIIKTNSSGDTIWTKTLDAGGSEEGFSIQQTLEGGYIVTGISGEFNHWDLWLIRLKADSTTYVFDEIFLNTFELSQNYPNPFNPSTKISYQIPASLNPSKGGTFVTLKVFDILGREITTLVNEIQNAGVYEIEFNASQLSSGIYLYVLKAGSKIQSKKMVLIR